MSHSGPRAADLVPDYTEWVQHRYDPGYWLGGRTPPELKRRASGNSLGCLLIASAVVTIVGGGLAIDRDSGLRVFESLFFAGFALIQLAAGLRLLRRNGTCGRG